MGDSVVRNIDSSVCGDWENCVVNCLLGAKVADITRHLDSLIDSAEEEPVVCRYQ